MNIDSSDLIIGILLPIIIMIIQLILRWRDKQISHITLIENKNIVLFPSLINKIDGLNIKYNKKNITGNLLFYQLTIFNSGVSDIPKSKIYAPLSLKLPELYKWSSYKIFDKSEGLDIEISSIDTELILAWDLLRVGEFVRIDTVIECSPECQLDNKISINNLLSNITFNKSRIVNLQISKKNIRNYEIALRNMKTYMFILLGFLLIYTMFPKYENHIMYDVNMKNIKSPIEFISKNDSIFLIDNLNNKVLYEQNNELKITNIHIQKEKVNDIHKTEIRIPLLFLLNLWAFILCEQYRMRKRRERLRLITKTYWNQFEIEDC